MCHASMFGQMQYFIQIPDSSSFRCEAQQPPSCSISARRKGKSYFMAWRHQSWLEKFRRIEAISKICVGEAVVISSQTHLPAKLKSRT